MSLAVGSEDLSSFFPFPNGIDLDAHGHSVQFYEGDQYLVEGVSRFIGGALGAGDAGIVIATPEHRAGLARSMSDQGLDLARAVRQGRYVELDAAETLASFMDAGGPDPSRFASLVGGAVDGASRAAGSSRRVAAFGEMVALLWADGQAEAAIRLEQLWNDLARTRVFSLHCAYPMHFFQREGDAASIEAICAEHSHVLPGESFAMLADEARLETIALLQQKAQALDTEVQERRKIEAELRQREAELRAALAARDDFLSVAAHELKTPLTTLRIAAQLIQRRFALGRTVVDTLTLDALIGRIDVQTAKVARLVDQLLDVSRLRRGHLTLDVGETELCPLVRNAVEDAQPSAPDHVFRLTTPVRLDGCVDALRLEQVVANLLDNAVKYSPGGGVVEVDLDEPRVGVARLVVRDHGIGIEPELRERIFEPFYRVPMKAQPAGTGLGLHICRQIVDLHHGELVAESPEDGGTRFVMTIPLQDGDGSR